MARKKGFVSEINVTPFVDVMMVLLIIFMVTAPMMDSGLDVDLPQAKQVDTLPSDSEHLVLTVREDGSLYLDTYEVPLEELEERLVTLVKDKDRALFLQKLGVVAMPSTESAAPAQSGSAQQRRR